MFEQLHEPRFTILEVVEQGEGAFFVWDFTFRMKSYKPEVVQTIHGRRTCASRPTGASPTTGTTGCRERALRQAAGDRRADALARPEAG
jgi:hypothetical protein